MRRIPTNPLTGAQAAEPALDTATIAETLRPILAQSARQYEDIGRRLRNSQDQIDAGHARARATAPR